MHYPKSITGEKKDWQNEQNVSLGKYLVAQTYVQLAYQKEGKEKITLKKFNNI